MATGIVDLTQIDSTHPSYDALREPYRILRDVLGGERHVKAAGLTYLSAPNIELDHRSAASAGRDPRYRNYIDGALFYPALKRTHQGMVGGFFQSEPKITLPSELDYLFKDATGSGRPLISVARRVVSEVLATSRYGLWVDIPKQDQVDPRVRLLGRAAENILDWGTRINANGDEVLDYVKLWERVDSRAPESLRERHSVARIRELYLDSDDLYAVDLYEADLDPGSGTLNRNQTEAGGRSRFTGGQAAGIDQATSDYAFVEHHEPRIRRQRMDFIPFVFISPLGLDVEPLDPILEDLSAINLSHYRASADLAQGVRMSAHTVIVTTGDRSILMNPDANSNGVGQIQDRSVQGPSNMVVGPGAHWRFSEPDVTVTKITFSDNDFGALFKWIEHHERLMAIVGAKLLEDVESFGSRTATEIVMRQSGEISVMVCLGRSVSMAIEQALRWAAMWQGAGEKSTSFGLNDDFLPRQADPQVLSSVMQIHQSGQMSDKTFYYNLEKASLTRPNVDFEQEQLDIEDNRQVDFDTSGLGERDADEEGADDVG